MRKDCDENHKSEQSSKGKKVKDWFKNNWKDIAVGAITIIAGAIAVMVNSDDDESQNEYETPLNDYNDEDEHKTIYTTQRWKGAGKQNYYWNKYMLEGSRVAKYKCHKQKFFDGDENNWEEDEEIEQSWEIDDPDMPDWLRNYL